MSNPKDRLKAAIAADDVEGVKRALSEGATACPPSWEGKNAFWEAAEQEKWGVFTYLCDLAREERDPEKREKFHEALSRSEVFGERFATLLGVTSPLDDKREPTRDAAILAVMKAWYDYAIDTASIAQLCNTLAGMSSGYKKSDFAAPFLEKILDALPPGPLPRGESNDKDPCNHISKHTGDPALSEMLIRHGEDLLGATGETGSTRYRSYISASYIKEELAKGKEYPKSLPRNYRPPFIRALLDEGEKRIGSADAMRSWLIDENGRATPALLSLASTDELRPMLNLSRWKDKEAESIALTVELVHALPPYYRYAYQVEPWPEGMRTRDSANQGTRAPIIAHYRDVALPHTDSVLVAYMRGATPEPGTAR